VKGVVDGHITGTEKRGDIFAAQIRADIKFFLQGGGRSKISHMIYKRNTDVNSVPLLST
jgi:hypothetical protein